MGCEALAPRGRNRTKIVQNNTFVNNVNVNVRNTRSLPPPPNLSNGPPPPASPETCEYEDEGSSVLEFSYSVVFTGTWTESE